jgi:hypothetical protein
MWEEDLSQYKRRLLVIATPFIEGTHFAKSIQQFVPLVEQLRDLHRDGYVHGDIRARNIAFAEGDGSRLFDWDLGGQVDTVVYPKGYNNVLADGTRRNKPGGLISRSDDWFAFSKVAFGVHKIEPPLVSLDKDSGTTLAAMYRRRDELGKVPSEMNDKDIDSRAGELIDFFRKATESGWTVKPGETFLEDLEMQEKKATGSPPKFVRRGEKSVEIKRSQSS